MEIVIDTDYTRNTLFQSIKNTKKTLFSNNNPNTSSFHKKIENADTNNGECNVELTKCPYSHEIIVKNIEFKVASSVLETFVMSVYSMS